MEPSEAEALVGAVDADLDAVEALLRRLDDASYGRCARCGHPLDRDRLHADPLRDHCSPPCGA